MSDDATATVSAAHHPSGADPRRRRESLVVESPLEIRCNGTLVATTMRTPGHDGELAVGFCRGEGYLRSTEVREVRCASAAGVDVADVRTSHAVASTAPRLGTVSSSCGVCGSTQIESLTSWLEPLVGVASPLCAPVIDEVTGAIRRRQELFEATGGSHAAALFDRRSGEVWAVREDIGRHNAVDKVVGSSARPDGVALGDVGLWISGRASFEMLQKAWAAGCATVVSVSAVSTLAVEIARVANIELIGFARSSGHTVYHDAPRSSR